MKIAYQGLAGAHSEAAAAALFPNEELVPHRTFPDVFSAVAAGGVEGAVVPVENSHAGSVVEVYDQLLKHREVTLVGEAMVRVKYCLLGVPGARLEAIRAVRSHPQSLAQCAGWLNRNLPGAERVPAASNAEAARLAASEDAAAAIAGEAAAERWDLAVLARAIEDDPANTTRFLVLGNVEPGPTGNDRTSLVMSAENKPGAVHALLTPLAANKVSMSRIESRPARARSALWEYVFFIDVEGHQKDTRVAAALGELRRTAPFLKFLGSYPVATA